METFVVVNSKLQYGTSKHFECLSEMSNFKFFYEKVKKLGMFMLATYGIYKIIENTVEPP